MERNPLVKISITSGVIGFVGMIALLSLAEANALAAGNGKGNGKGNSGGSDTVTPDTSGPLDGGTPDDTPDIDYPEMIELTGLVRDFHERTAENGHTDFELQPDLGWGLYAGNVAPFIGEDGKPVYTGDGHKVVTPWMDALGRPICHLLYDASLGDVAGSAPVASTGAIESTATFNQWFHDSLGVNMSSPLTLDLHRQADGTYVFDDKLDSQYSSLGGFFPIEDQLFGNPGGSPDRNFHFTFELHTEFVYDATAGQNFMFIGDDDVFVYIDGRLVIDLGGVHPAAEQYVDLDRLGLTHGSVYRLDFFFAERHRTQSNFRIQTNIPLVSLELPPISAVFD